MPSLRHALPFTLIALGVGLEHSQTLASEEISFARDIQPILAKHCLLCHGPDEQEGGLRLDTEKGAFAKLDSDEHAIVAGKPEHSELLNRVKSTDEATQMPPEGERLTDRQISFLQRWISSGAKFTKHWAYQPVQEPTLPTVKQSWSSHPIDLFVLHRLEKKQLRPSSRAARHTLIKRLYYDLVGLAPSPNEVEAFVNDESEDSYEQLVDQLLASPRFGERWGRHWLDKARYADSDGYEKDRPRPNAWRYRDWVIQAINNDLPYDQFSIEQLAGDLLSEATSEQLLATAFHRQTLTNTEGGTDREQFRVEATFDRAETTASIWMGLTLTCARCHTHKYDQITQKEYYQFYSFFNDANEGTTEVFVNSGDDAGWQDKVRRHAQEIQKLEQQIEGVIKAEQSAIETWAESVRQELSTPQQNSPLDVPQFVSGKSSTGAKLSQEDDGAWFVSGKTADKDKYTFVFEAPEQFFGVQIDTLPDDRLPGKGAGRAPNGNFVISQIRVYQSEASDFKSHQPIALGKAVADFAQNRFPAADSLVKDQRRGWAVAPQMTAAHQLTIYAARPVATAGKFIQLVIDQQYGGQHTLGRFRIRLLSKPSPAELLPKDAIKSLHVATAKRSKSDQRAIARAFLSQHTEHEELLAKLAKLQEQAPQRAKLKVRVISPAKRTTRVLHRGDFLQPGDEVISNGLQVALESAPLVGRNESNKTVDRLDLASWLASPEHPLTARVTVNQVWSHLFGRGIVPTINDFGVRGDAPTHPELLDYLAWHFPRSMNWSRKSLIKTIVMSATYQQDSVFRQDLEQDPTNRFFGRQNRVRVEAEIIRDLCLDVSGLLSNKVGGPSVFPPLPRGVAELSYANNFKWKTSSGADRYRRGLYTFFKRTSPHPNLISFDCPDSNSTSLARSNSNTPLQALIMLNNEVYSEAAQAFAKKILSTTDQSDNERMRLALQSCVYRMPTASETARFLNLLEGARNYYRENPEQAKQAVKQHSVTEVTAEENAAWVATLRIMLNLDEFIVRD